MPTYRFSPLRLLRTLLLALVVTPAATLLAQSFSVSPNTVAITAVAGVNHLPFQVPVTYSPANYDWTKIAVTSDSPWVTGAIDSASGNLAFSFATADLVKRTYTATVTLTEGSRSAVVMVQATVSPLSVTRLLADPTRSRVYAIQQDGLNAGSVLVYDPVNATYVGELTVGKKPCDLALSKDGSEMLVICSASQAITVVDLSKLVVRETLPLSPYADWGSGDTSAHVGYGPANIIYYTDGAWAPVLHVFDRTTKTSVQNVQIDPTSGNGWGGFVLSPDQTRLYGWAQYGWSAGWTGCYLARHAVASDGKLTFQAQTSSTYPTGLNRDPLNTPAMMSADGKVLVVKQVVVDPAALGTVLQSTPTPIFAISPNAEILATESAIYSSTSGNKLYTLPKTATVQAITWDYSRLVYFDATAKALAAIDLTKALSLATLGLNRTPADQAIVLAPTRLQWSPVVGVTKYQVYLGTSAAAVTAATTTSSEYLGVATSPSLALSRTLTAGQTYYWRVDSVGANGVVAGPVSSFTVSSVASDTSSVNAATVQVHKAYPVSIGLSSATAGKTWQASADVPWITFGAATGTTPATVAAFLDATQLKPGTSQGTIAITTDEGTFSIPVKLLVEPLALTVVRSSPQSTKVYAISEYAPTSGSGSGTATRAYLLEIDSLLQQVTRVVPVGSSATDLAIHRGDNRVYVPNWRPGGLLAVNLTTFKVERTYATPPFGGVGYSTGDVYRVSAGVAGRLITEEEDQWIDISIFDTDTGLSVGKAAANTYAGGGQTDPTGRYYYHGDSAVHKFDLIGDKMTEIAASTPASGGYSNTRNLVISEDGSHVYWNGVAFDANLKMLTKLGDDICATSRDGRYAFSKTKVYDITNLNVVATMPTGIGSALAYNTATGRVVGQVGDGLVFSTPLGGTVLGDGLAPVDGAIVTTLSKLTWTTLPGVESYQVYVGASATAVAQATTGSPEYVGAATSGSIAVPSSVTPGKTYYWRVDLVVGGAVVATQSQSFTLSKVVPNLTQIEAVTVQGYAVPVTLSLTSASTAAWTATAADPWVSIASPSGNSPGTLAATLDATKLPAGTSTSEITVSGAWGTFTIPVTLRVDALALTVMRSDPQSAKVYAINEPKVTSGTSHAFLLEIDSASEQITRSVQVGSSATDLAIHRGDNRVYVTNWQTGGVVGIDLGSFAIDRTLATPAYGDNGEDDAYRIAGVVAGRLVTEAEDQWINVNLYDTVTGTKLATTFQREGGGQFESTGRYYYHGDNNSSGAQLHKLDLLADKFTEVAASVRGANGYGGRTVVVTEDDSRVFWARTMFDANAQVLWTMSDEVFTATKDGRYAVAATKIYDTTLRQAVLAVPGGGGAVSAVNTTTGKLVLQNGTRIRFYRLDPNSPLNPPVLANPTSATTTSIALSWASDSLQTGFTLQLRPSGSTSWSDVSSTIPGSTTSYTVTSLTPGTTYDFRIKADSPATSSGWSNIVSATSASTLPMVVQQPVSQVIAPGGTATFSVTVSNAAGVTYQWHKNGQPIAGATSSTLTIANVSETDVGTYTVKITNSAGTVTSWSATLANGNARIVNFSIRSMSGSDAAVLVVGFGTSGGSKTLLLRGIGPGLAGFGVPGYLPDPQLKLYAGLRLTNINDNWSASGGTQIAVVAAQVGAFSLAQGSLDSSLYTTLAQGAYTMQIPGANATTGVVLAEIYDTTASAVGRLVNVSARTLVGSDDNALIAGFVITGTGKKTVLIRAVGPGLAGFGVSGVLADPTLDVFAAGSSSPLASNNDWNGTAPLVQTFAQTGAFALESTSKDAALVLQLSAGSYSAVVHGANGTSGIALLEVYEVQ